MMHEKARRIYQPPEGKGNQWAFCTLLLSLVLVVCSGCGRIYPLKSLPATPASRTIMGTPSPTRVMPSVALGAAVGYDQLRADQQYRATVRQSFQVLVPENEMKFAETEPARGVFDFTQADAIVSFAQANNMWVRGHTLVWGDHLPDWLTHGNFTHDEIRQILKNHVETLVSHYRGRVSTWDVVNEAFDGDQLRQNFWLQALGPDYIREAFVWAHEADPQATLFFNDYGDDEIGPKFDATFHLLTSLKAQGVPIDGLGMEMHLGFGAPPDVHAVTTNMQRLRAAGLQAAVTEIDVQIHHLPGTHADQLQEQAQIYAEMANACRIAGNCHYFVAWGVTDKYTWLTPVLGYADEPLLFDMQYRPKPAYFAVRAALAGSFAATPTPTVP